MTIKKSLIFAFVAATATVLSATQTMVGDVGVREARVWFNGAGSDVSATCTAGGKKFEGAIKKAYGNAAGESGVAIFSGLKAGTDYEYSISGKDGKVLASGAFKTAPDHKDRTPPPDFAFAVFGENYVNDKEFDPPFKTPGGEYEIYSAAASKKPAFCIWADGMNTLRNADESSESAKFLRGVSARDLGEVKDLISKFPNYGVAARNSFYGKNNDSNSANIADASCAFDMLWANPAARPGGAKAYSFQYADAEFFVLDDCTNRSYLDYRENRPSYLGDAQLNWLMGALQNSKANFKFVVLNSPFANPVATRDNFAFSANERKILSDFLVFAKIPGVVFLSANKPYGELSRLIRAGGYPLYDLTVGPLTGRPVDEIAEMNYFRVPSSSITKRSFAMVKVDGPEDDRAVTFAFFDSKGGQLFSSTVKLSELKKFE